MSSKPVSPRVRQQEIAARISFLQNKIDNEAYALPNKNKRFAALTFDKMVDEAKHITKVEPWVEKAPACTNRLPEPGPVVMPFFAITNRSCQYDTKLQVAPFYKKMARAFMQPMAF